MHGPMNIKILRLFADSGKIFRYQVSWKSDQWSRVASCGRAGKQGGMKKLILTFRNLTNVIKKKGQKKKTRKDIMNNVCSVSWYGHHHTYRFTILEQNTLLHQKLIQVSWN